MGMTKHRILILLTALYPLTPGSAASATDWVEFGPARGMTVQYPRDIFPVDAGRGDHDGTIFATLDGRARLNLFTIANDRHETPRQFLKRSFPEDRRALTYDRVASNFFAVSESKKGRIYYRRCNFGRDGLIRCVDLQYPANEKRAWDEIVTRVSLSLRQR